MLFNKLNCLVLKLNTQGQIFNKGYVEKYVIYHLYAGHRAGLILKK